MKTRPVVVLFIVVKMDGANMTQHCVISHKSLDIKFRENARNI
jgi:hypothetical protein